jgi:hypothetical protein
MELVDLRGERVSNPANSGQPVGLYKLAKISRVTGNCPGAGTISTRLEPVLPTLQFKESGDLLQSGSNGKFV